ncbi:hypothetical protein LJR143_002388 [Pseudoxanthomonas sp. LjRoot143]|uniref:hypothetical protein n=1 Tax=unclassified Pseudoxanthomonas TaxID=2645906 RepID=UPI0017830F1C|nr:hypothetical protein [Pseudoxanthomonas sp. PXM01]MBD9469458.1 hypothetical protein [Pseudoxanthomonas sp. PXM01]
MLLYTQTHLHSLLERLETSDARATGQLEALTVWVAALVQTHPDGERLRASAQALSARNPFRALCQYQEEVAAYDATFCQMQSLASPADVTPRVRVPLPPRNV